MTMQANHAALDRYHRQGRRHAVLVGVLAMAALAALLLDEKLHGFHLAGMAVILIGIVLGAWADARQRKALYQT